MTVLLSCWSLASSSWAQSSAAMTNINNRMPKPVAASPNVASLGKYGDYEPSSYNGLAPVSIPLIEVQSGTLTLPVSLSYHGSGIKRMDHAGWVGAGWTLNAGGQLSRRIQGKEDEGGYYVSNTADLHPSPIDPCTQEGTDYLHQVVYGGLDTQPDLFSYSFPGKSGKFLLRHKQSGPPLLLPAEPIKVDVINFSHFEITNEFGVVHRFGKNATTGLYNQETSFFQNGGNMRSGVNAWMLSEMIAPNSNDKISWKYQNLGPITYIEKTYIATVDDLCDLGNIEQFPCPQSNPVVLEREAYTNLQPIGPEEIAFETGKLKFILSGNRQDEPGSKALEYIEVYSLTPGGYRLVKSFKFIYSYFKDLSNVQSLMLRLDGIHVRDDAGNILQQYGFTYTTNNLSWSSNQSARDMWGYYNGKNANVNLFPEDDPEIYQPTNVTPSAPFDFRNADRSPDTTLMKEGVLRRIDYPTGGFTEFEYESNRFIEGVSTQVKGGGLRVRFIKTSDGIHPATVKRYFYGTGTAPLSGYGAKNFNELQLNYHSEQTVVRSCCLAASCPNPNSTIGTTLYRTRAWFSSSAYDVDGYNDAAVVYPVVTERLEAANGSTLGKTVYVYDNGIALSTGVNIVSPHSGSYYRDTRSWDVGFLTSVTVHDANGDIVKVTANSFGNYLYQPSNFIGWMVNFVRAYNGDMGCATGALNCLVGGTFLDAAELEWTYLTQGSGARRLDQVSETIYQHYPDLFTTTTQSNSYDPAKLLLVSTTTQRSNSNELAVAVNRYPFQIAGVSSSSTGSAQSLYQMINKNIIGTPVETYQYLSTDGANQRVTSASWTQFKTNPNNTNHVIAEKVYAWTSQTPITLPSFAPLLFDGAGNPVMDSRYQARVNITCYDGDSNVVAASKSDNVDNSYLYGYGNTLPVAEIVNAGRALVPQPVMLPSTAVGQVTLGGPTSGPIQTVVNFTTQRQGTAHLRLGVNATPNYSTVLSWSGIGFGTQTLTVGGCALTDIVFPDLPTASYSLTLTLTTPDAGIPSLGACGEVEYPVLVPGFVPQETVRESAYVNFEESTGANVVIDADAAHTGSRYFAGDLTVDFAPTGTKTYRIEYWYKDATSSKWVYKSNTYSPGVVLSDGTAIDDVRIYPVDAQMKSYTYEPLLGMTSTISENGQTLIYQYDKFGRLWRIMNDQGTIEKQYDYHYKGN